MEKSIDLNPTRPQTTLSMKDIKKETMSETYRHLNILIKEKSIGNLNELISSSTELSLYDESLRLILIDSLHLEKDVIKIFLSQNDYQIKRLLRCKWFFKNLSSEFCIKELFPKVSLSLRCKIITELSKNLESEEEAEKYFNFTQLNYGNDRAEFLLPRCSREFILNHFSKNNSLLNNSAGARILLGICVRYPETGLQILSIIFDRIAVIPYQKCNIKSFRKIMHFLAGNHTDLFVPFLKKYSANAFLGRMFGKKLTRKLGAKLAEDSFPNILKYSVLNKYHWFSFLCSEDKAKLLSIQVLIQEEDKLTFSSWTNCTFEISKFLKLVKPNDRLDVINSAFKQLFNKDFFHCPKCWSYEVLELLPTEVRQPYAKELEKYYEDDPINFEKNVNPSNFTINSPEQYIYLYDFTSAFAKFKKILKKSPDVGRRGTILTYMVKNCSINSDLKGLQEAVEFFCSRYRNDDPNLIFDFMSIIKTEFSWSSLNSIIFEKMEQMAYFCILKGHINSYGFKDWQEKHIYYRLENGLNVDEQVKSYFEEHILKEEYLIDFINDYKCKHSKTLLLSLLEKVMNWIRTNTSDVSQNTSNTLVRNMLLTCSGFKENNKTSPICLKEINGLQEILNKNIKALDEHVGEEDWPFEIWEKYYGDVLNSYYLPKCLLYVLKRNPDIIMKHLHSIINHMMKSFFNVYKGFYFSLLKAISFYEKTNEVKELILKEFKRDDKDAKREGALVLYSYICTIEEFNKAIEEYIPERETIEGTEDQRFSRIQLVIPKLIRNVRPRWKNLELILKFFKGDFLKSVMPTFYACCYNTRADVVIPFLKKHLKSVPQRISYIKDTIRLIAEVCTRDQRTEFCQECWESNKHYSIRTIILMYVSKMFAELPSQESFKILEKYILDCDDITIEKRPDLEQIPDEFFNDFVLVLWRFSENQKPSLRISLQQSVMNGLHGKKINLLSKDFCEELIKNNLFSKTSRFSIGEFVISYVTADENVMESRIRMILDLIKETKADPGPVSSFLHIIMSRSVPARLYAIILENWPEYPLGILIDEHVLFTYHSLHRNVLERCEDQSLVAEEFAKELKKLYSVTENLNELLIIHSEALNKFFGDFKTPKAILTVKALVSDTNNRTLALLGILALPSEAVSWFKKGEEIFDDAIKKSKEELNELVKIFQSFNDDIVEIYTRRKFFG